MAGRGPRTHRGRRPTGATLSTVIVLLLAVASMTLPGASPSTAPNTYSGAVPAPAPSSRPSVAVAAAESSAAPEAAGPAAAPAISVTGQTPSAIAFGWTATSALGFENYTLGLSVNGSAGPFTTVQVLTTQSTASTTYAGLSPAGTYWWRLSESTFLGGTTYSGVVQATQPAAANLTLTVLTATDVRLNWTNAAAYGGGLVFVHYDVYEIAAGGSPAILQEFSSVGSNSTGVSGLSPGASYAFYVNTTDCTAACTGSTPALSITASNTVTLGTPLPLTASLVATRPVVDVGELDLFTCTPSGGASPFSFAWDLGNGTFVNGGNTLTASFAANGSAVVTCRVTDSTPSEATVAVTITVDPALLVSATTNRTAADVGQSASLDCAASQGLAPYSIGWQYGGTETSGESAIVDLGTAGAFSATCLVVDATGTPASAAVSINVSLPLSVSVSVDHLEAAPGTALAFAAVAANGSGTYATYAWSFSGAADAGPTGPSADHAFAVAGRPTANVSVTDTNGETAIGGITLTIVNITVAVTSAPTAAMAGDGVVYRATAAGGGGPPYAYRWNFGDAHSATTAAATHEFAGAGTYQPTLQVTDGLGGSTNVSLPSVVVTVAPPPAPLLSLGLLLLLAILIGAVTAAVVETVHRRRQARLYPLMAGRVPATSAAGAAPGRRVCRACGTSNLPTREACDACGAPLRGGLF